MRFSIRNKMNIHSVALYNPNRQQKHRPLSTKNFRQYNPLRASCLMVDLMGRKGLLYTN